MKISNLNLEAFLEVARKQNITEAAKVLGVTQSALSQRIMKLEDDLETTLFIRETKNIILTDSGIKLLKYAQNLQQLEEEILFDLKGNILELAGKIRIAGYSSVMRSLIIPKLQKVLKDNSQIDFEFSTHEMHELPDILLSGKADIVIMDYVWLKDELEKFQIGIEEFVEIESKKTAVVDFYLDHDQNDNATISFFDYQGAKNKKIERKYMGDVYSIIDGVKLGLGKAIMSKHLIKDDPVLKIIQHKRKYIRPIIGYYFKKTYYPKLFKEVLENLT